MGRIRVLVADDHQIVREGLRALLSDEPDIELVGEAADGEDALRRCEAAAPDVVLMDVGLRPPGSGEGIDGVEATRRLRAARPTTAVIVLSMHDDPLIVGSALRAGARGYVVKGRGISSLLSAIRSVHGGEIYLSPGLETATPLPGDAAGPLSQREREILVLVAEGLSGPQIAERLGLKAKTIENHRARIMDKLGIHTTAGLVRYALRTGLAR